MFVRASEVSSSASDRRSEALASASDSPLPRQAVRYNPGFGTGNHVSSRETEAGTEIIDVDAVKESGILNSCIIHLIK